MAGNIFDRYYESEYTPLPIEDISRGLNYRELQHQENLAAMDQLEDLWRKVNYLPQDEEVRNNMIQQYRSQLDNFAKSGDYSQSKPFIRRLANRFNEDMTSGALGYIQRSYDEYQKDIQQIDKSDRPDFEKQLAKQMRFSQYKGINPNEDMFSQYYKASSVPEYIDIMKEAKEYLKDVKPKESEVLAPWLQTADGLRWIQNGSKVESLPKEQLFGIATEVLKNNPKVLNSLAFSASVRGEDPNDYIANTITGAADTLSDIYKVNNTKYSQNMENTLEWQYDLTNTAMTNQDYEDMEYESTRYFDKFGAIANSTAKANASPDDKGTLLQSPTGFVKTSGPTKGKDFKVAFPDKEAETMYNNIAKLVKGKDDKETYDNVQKWIKNVKDKKLSTKMVPFSVKQSTEETKYIQNNFLSRKFLDPETGEVYSGHDLIRDREGILSKAIKNTAGKDKDDLLKEMALLGKVSPDNPYIDISGQKDFAAGFVARIGDKRFIVSPSAGELNSPSGQLNSMLSVVTRPNRTGLPINLGNELEKLNISAFDNRSFKDIQIIPFEGGYNIINVMTNESMQAGNPEDALLIVNELAKTPIGWKYGDPIQ